MTLNRVVELKLSGKSKEFQESWDRTLDATRRLFNGIVCWGNDSVYTKTFVNQRDGYRFGQMDLKPQRHALYLATDRSVPEEVFDKILKVAYTKLVSAGQSRGLTNPLIGNIIKYNEPLTAEEIEWLDEPSNWKDINMAHIGATLRNMGVRKALAWDKPLSSSEKYCVMGNVHRMLTSWVAQNTETQEKYKSEEHEIANLLGQIDQSEQQILQDFLNLCIDNHYIRWFDGPASSYFKDCVIPAVRDGGLPIEHFCLDQRGAKRKFSLNTELLQYILEHPALIENDLLIKSLPILELMTSHGRHRPGAAFPFIGETDHHRFQYLLGSNYVSYGLHGDSVVDLEDQTIVDEDEEIVFSKGTKPNRVSLRVSHQSATDKLTKDTRQIIQFEIHSKDRYRNGKDNPSQYFKDLTFWNKEQTYLLKWNRKGQVMTGLLKEPSIVRHKGQYFVRMSFTVPMDVNADLEWFLKSAAPSAKDAHVVIQESQKNQERLARLQGTVHKIMGVDLGLKSPFAYHVTEVSVAQNGLDNTLRPIDTGDLLTPENQSYQRLLRAAINTQEWIKVARYSDRTPSPFALKLVEDAKEFFTSYTKLGGRRAKLINDFLKDADPTATLRKMAAEGLSVAKMNPAFLPHILYRYCQILHGRIVEQRRLHYQNGGQAVTKWDQEYRYMKCLEEMKKVARSLSYLGTDNDRTPIETLRYNRIYVSSKSNFLKQIASKIAEKARHHGCEIIVLEQLQFVKQMGSKQQNALLSLWSPEMLKTAVENAAGWYGIGVSEVSAQMTSQTHYESRRLGWRDGSNLHCEVEGKIITVDADQNAAKNIALRCARRHTDLNRIFIGKGGDTGEAKRQSGALTHAFGSVQKAKQTLKTPGYWYRDGNQWIPQTDWWARRKALEKKIRANSSEGAD